MGVELPAHTGLLTEVQNQRATSETDKKKKREGERERAFISESEPLSGDTGGQSSTMCARLSEDQQELPSSSDAGGSNGK